jgi:phage recombination protein Bet
MTVTADLCPVCDHVHGTFDEFWGCPRPGHEHALIFLRVTGDVAIYICPLMGCKYQRIAPAPGKGHAVTVTEPASATLAIRDGQDFWDAKQMAALTQLGIKDASNADLAVYLHYCQKTGLDPFSRQIYMLARRVKVDGEWETRQTIQIGIDGYRIIASRAARRDGVTVSYGQAAWYDEDGRAYAVWTRPEPPAAAMVIVRRGADSFPGIARFASFAAFSREGRLMGQWATMPDHMIAKCAEAQALRRAFPHDLAGTQTTDETAHDRTMPHEEMPAPSWLPSAGDLERERELGLPDGEDVPPQPLPKRSPRQRKTYVDDGSKGINRPPTLAQQITAEFERLGVEDRPERRSLVVRLAGLDEDTTLDAALTNEVLGPVLADLKQCTVIGDVYERTSERAQAGEPGE